MTPKEKAKELKDKFQKQIFFHVTDERLDINEAKGLALIAVNELIKSAPSLIEIERIEHIKYWVNVGEEIEKL
jgi:hypothetical protein